MARSIYPPVVLADAEMQRQLKKMKIGTLVRIALKKRSSPKDTVSLGGQTTPVKLNKVNVNEPEVFIMLSEATRAHEIMKIFREEDR